MEERQYRVDRHDVIEWLDPRWDAFALQNDAPELTGGAVLQRPIRDFLTGGETRHVYDALFAQVRRSGRPVTVPFRCDSPGLLRSMELVIAPGDEGALLLTAILLEARPRPRADLLAAGAARDLDAFVLMCSWCKRIEARSAWQEVEHAVRTLGLFEAATVPQITHGICPDCQRKIRQLFVLC